jgi:hypothetical protein
VLCITRNRFLSITYPYIPTLFKRWKPGWVMSRMTRYSTYVHTQAAALVTFPSYFSSRVMILRDSYCIGFRTRFCFLFWWSMDICSTFSTTVFLFIFCSICSICTCVVLLDAAFDMDLGRSAFRTWIRGLVALVLTLFCFYSLCFHLGFTWVGLCVISSSVDMRLVSPIYGLYFSRYILNFWCPKFSTRSFGDMSSPPKYNDLSYGHRSSITYRS